MKIGLGKWSSACLAFEAVKCILRIFIKDISCHYVRTWLGACPIVRRSHSLFRAKIVGLLRHSVCILLNLMWYQYLNQILVCLHFCTSTFPSGNASIGVGLTYTTGSEITFDQVRMRGKRIQRVICRTQRTARTAGCVIPRRTITSRNYIPRKVYTVWYRKLSPFKEANRG